MLDTDPALRWHCERPDLATLNLPTWQLNLANVNAIISFRLTPGLSKKAIMNKVNSEGNLSEKCAGKLLAKQVARDYPDKLKDHIIPDFVYCFGSRYFKTRIFSYDGMW